MNQIEKMALALANNVLENSDDTWLLQEAQELKTYIQIYEDELPEG